MNILLLTHSYPDPNHSWRGTFIKEQARALSKNNHVIVVYFRIDYGSFAPFAGYSFIRKVTGNLFEYTLTISRSFPLVNQAIYLLKTYKFIKNEILNNIKPDLIHSHLSYPAGLLGTIIQKRRRIPGFITEHSRVNSYFRSFFHIRSVFYALKNATCIIAVSNPLKDEIYSLTHRTANVINNIVDTDRFKLVESNPVSTLNIGFLGGLGNNNKGLDLLLTAASLLENNNFLLHIGGNGALLDYYKQMARELRIENKCRYYGEILPEDIPAFYAGLDLFILPSRYETFGIVLIEAMACGIPVIATKCGGPQEIITALTGLLVEKDNPEELARAIHEISGNLFSYNKEAIRRYADEKFGQKVFIDKISQLYTDVLEGEKDLKKN
jgi:glycosyltransferase involved in cell wall biosynthesis